MRILDRHLAAAYAAAASACLTGLAVIYLLVDFVDRARLFTGPGWARAALELYAAKLAVVGWQLAPAALILGAVIALSGLRGRGELAALGALGVSPARLAAPLVAVALAAGAGLWWFGDAVAAPAERRAEEITVRRFQLWGDWALYHSRQRWYRDGARLWRIAGEDGGAFTGVTILEIDDAGGAFRLARRTDAARLVAEPGGGWTLDDATVRTFAKDGTVTEARRARLSAGHFEPERFRVRAGRPSQLRRRELDEQIAARRQLGLPTREFELARAQKDAYPLLGLPGCALGAALALRRNRRGGLTAAIVEGTAATAAIWALATVLRALALSGHLPVAAGAWGALVVAAVAGAVGLARARLTR